MSPPLPRRAFRWIWLAAAVTLPACGDGTGNTGALTASLVTPNADDGIVLVSVSGPALDQVVAGATAYRIYSAAVTPGELRLVVAGNLQAGTLFTAQTPAGVDAADYQVTVLQVASRVDALRSTAGYSIGVSVAR